MGYRRKQSKATKAIVADEISRDSIVAQVRNWHAERKGLSYEDTDRIREDHPDVITILQWRAAASQVIAKVCSVLGEVTVPVEWSFLVPLAATDGEKILLGNDWFNNHMIGQILDRRTGDSAYHWGEFKAMAYHELSHIIWTPRFTQKPTTDLKKRGNSYECLRAMNILEDQRIESLFVARYAPSIPMFTHLVSKHIVQEGDSHTAHLLVHGRKYLPLKVRAICHDNMVAEHGQKAVDEFSALIDEYRTLVFPTDHARAHDIIVRFVELANECGMWLPNAGSDGHEDHRTGRPESVADQREDQEARQRSDERLEKADDADADGDSDGADGEGDDGDTDADDNGGKGNEEGGDDATGSGSDTADKPSDAPSDDGDSDGNGGSPMAGAFKELIEQTKDKVLEDGRQAVKSVAKVVSDIGSEGTIPTAPDERNVRHEATAPWMNVGTKRLQEKITRIFNDYEERWVTGLPSGRLNVTEAMNARGTHFDVFESFQDSDEEATSFEVVILVDRSGSMGRRAVEDLSDKVYTPEEWKDTFVTLSTVAQQAMWTIRYAFQSLDIPVTVIGYDDSPTLMAAPWTTPATRGKCGILPDMGGTNPDGALRWAKTILSTSSAKNRLLITLTDGEWWTSDMTIEHVEAIRAIGGQTLLVSISPGYFGADAEKCKNYAEAAKPQIEAGPDGRRYGHDEFISLTGLEMRRLPDEVGERIARLSQAVLTV